MAHAYYHQPERDGYTGKYGAAAPPILELSDADTKKRTDQRGAHVDVCISNAAYAEISHQWFGNQAETLRSTRQRSNHCKRRNIKNKPPIVKPRLDARRSSGFGGLCSFEH